MKKAVAKNLCFIVVLTTIDIIQVLSTTTRFNLAKNVGSLFYPHESEETTSGDSLWCRITGCQHVTCSHKHASQVDGNEHEHTHIIHLQLEKSSFSMFYDFMPSVPLLEDVQLLALSPNQFFTKETQNNFFRPPIA